MKHDLYEYTHYKEYLNDWLDDPARGGGYGSRAKFAQAINCQTSYVAQVLKGHSHFSLEQIEAANDFMGHSEQEGLFLINLVQFERAGITKLKKRFEKQLDSIRESRLELKNRLGTKQALSSEYQSVYYSSWYYAVIHVIASQNRFSTARAISEYLNLDARTVNQALEFLIESGLVERKGAGFRVGRATMHLGSDSPLISKHHENWRLQAIRSLEKGPKKNDLHYSSVNTLSKKDAMKIREFLTKVIVNAQDVIKDSPEEDVLCLSVDFFEI